MAVFPAAKPALRPHEAAEIDDDFRIELEPPTRRFLTAIEIENLPKPDYRMRDVIVNGSLVVLYGPPGCFKSFLALGWALSVATGFRWVGHEVIRAPIIYVAAEGSAGIGARVRAWREHHGYGGNLDAYFLTSPANLMQKPELARMIADIAEELDQPPGLIVIDTLSRDLAGADENSQAEMSAYVSNLDTLRRVTGAAVLVVHHTNASAERERGSTVLRGAADTMIQIKNDDGSIVISCEKQKDDAPFDKLYLELQPVGESAVLTAKSALQLPSSTASQKEVQALQSLQELSPPSGLPASKWLELSELKQRTFYLALKSLNAKGLVIADRDGRGALYRVTPEGLDVLTANCKLTANSLHCSNGNSLHAMRGVLGTPQPCSNSQHDDDAELWEKGRA